MARIVILGCAGSGKTTLARQLGELIGAPIVCLDSIWQPDWSEKDGPTFRHLIQQTHAGDQWISDGNFALATFDIRLPRATQVVWLERPRLYCAWRVVTRVLKHGEPHRLSGLAKVLAFIWRFDRVNRPRIEAARIAHGPNVPVCRLRKSREVEAFLSSYHDSVPH